MAVRPTTLADVLAPENNAFGVIRLLLAIAVLVSHSFYFTTGLTQSEPLTELTGHSLGEHAVQAFFILSGLLVCQSLANASGVGDFALARVLRIFPGLIVCVLLTVVILGLTVGRMDPMAFFAHPMTSIYVAKTSLLMTASAPLPGVFETLPVARHVNGSLWTLKYEALCYVGLALFGLLRLRRADTIWLGAPALVGVMVLGSVALPTDTNAYSSLHNVAYFGVFFATGVLMFLLRETLVIRAIYLVPFVIAFVLTKGTPLYELATALALGYAILVAGAGAMIPWTAFTNRQDYSFGVYIYATPVQQALLWPLVLSAIALALVLPLAVFSWNVIERPAMGLRRPIREWVSRVWEPPAASEDFVDQPVGTDAHADVTADPIADFDPQPARAVRTVRRVHGWPGLSSRPS
jgi:peptidoglycan/LPS O-acetylase OafA/YrhL